MVYDFIRLLSGVLIFFFFNLLLVLFEALKSDGDITLLLLTQGNRDNRFGPTSLMSVSGLVFFNLTGEISGLQV